ncbi:MAG: site-specific integrase [Liquorilactobacillus nagelii]|uniref:Core-binding (CB) domain-containing protein n=1 Tax=Liquorilactobacillus nagelii TaxID=82688 RepID=A0A3S6R102_9LACO|nr:site-specific integrase [Liquorilactobacillus nagelii]AUJ32187.1 hypothetical protein BSQ50_06235 [Liquorilactobacillus nagelii]KRL40905.1 integrase recombinase xerD [Liquorilactobacillus nagelii DSM 13675]MCC7615357.1 integrase [Liquorilactobacillus nagelii]MCI1700219.1 site-specific integrase [Liquorilactobacillus nagelii]MCP9315939.1 site-specific integrase [Liquorilactobacillus nagelii]
MYPYQTVFENHLFQQKLASSTILSYRHDLLNFFTAMTNKLETTEPDQITTSDLREYFFQMKKAASITDTTYNKILSHLNQYFIFLFQANLISSLPTLSLKGAAIKSAAIMPINWSNQLPVLLSNSELSFYTRLALLLIAHFYAATEFLQPGFYLIWQIEKLTAAEQSFMQQFEKFHQPLCQRQNSSELFLKQRHSNNPSLTLPALHKYLQRDQDQVAFPLTPQKLRTAAICNFLQKNRQLTNQTCCRQLHLDLNSLNYYRLLSFSTETTKQV